MSLASRNAEIDTWIAWSTPEICPVRIRVPRFIPASQKSLERIANEYIHLSDWTHVNMTRAYHAEFKGKLPYSILEYFDSLSVADLLRQSKHELSLFDLVCIGHDISTALKFVHKKGFVHTDLSTRIIRKKRKLWVLTECDQLTEVDTVLNDLNKSGHNKSFEAPEISDTKDARFAMDVYSLGKILYRVATGNITDEYDLSLEKVIPRPLQPISNIIAAMLRVEPNNRPSMERVQWEFKRLMSEGMLSDRDSSNSNAPINYKKQIVLNNLANDIN